MRRESGTSGARAGDYIEFRAAGEAVKGEFHCAQCGYGVTIVRTLPLCPMCGGDSWERTSWHPFTHGPAALL
jgi:rubrerythrin